MVTVINPFGLHVYGESRDIIEEAYNRGESSVVIDGRTVNIEGVENGEDIEIRVEVV